jgi:general secretion pathway protein K
MKETQIKHQTKYQGKYQKGHQRLSQKGIALVSVIFIVILIIWIASEMTHETTIEYQIHSKAIQKLQAYHTARSGIELSLLRLHVYKTVKNLLESQLGDQASLLNMIWSYPLMWPPKLGENQSLVKKEMLEDQVEESTLKGEFITTITDEGSKLDINDLGSSSEKVQELTKNRVLQMIQDHIRLDPDFAKENQNVSIENLLIHIADWIDGNDQSPLGQSEKAFYPKGNQLLPPNRGFRSLDELQLVATMTPSLFKFLKDKITVYGQKAINPNTASSEVLKSLDISLTEEVISEVIKRRDNPELGGPFKSADDFWSFVNSRGGMVTNEKQADIPMIFDEVMSFRIRSGGHFNGQNHTIEIVVWDYHKIVEGLATNLAKEVQGHNGNENQGSLPGQSNPGGNPSEAPTNKPKVGNTGQKQDNRPPPIVYWSEK